MLDRTFIAALNHLLEQSGWALRRLAKFRGRIVRLEIMPFSIACIVLEDGSVLDTIREASADAVLTVPPSLLPRLALNDETVLDQIETSGDAAFIEEIFFLMRNLRWDAAEDISRVTGDVAAERIVGFAKGAHQQVRDTVLNLSQAATEYWTEERPLIAKSSDLSGFSDKVAKLREEVENLEQRINKLIKS